jgi:flagellin
LSSANGSLQISGSGALAVAVDAATGGTAIQAAVADADAKVNTGKFYFDGGTVTANTTGAQTLSFTPAGGSIIDIAIAATDSKESIVNKLKTGLANSNINVVRIGDEISFQSETDFAVQRDATAGGTGGLGNVAISFNAAAANNATDKSASSDVTANALAALAAIGNAVSTLGTVQGKIGSGQNKLQYAIQLAQSQITNFSAAESRIRDADVAQEAANLTKAQVLSQASMAALAQANSAPQSVLSLLRG